MFTLLRGLVNRFPALRGVARSPLGQALRRRLVRGARPLESEHQPPVHYADYRVQRIDECRETYPNEREEGLLSFITTVWNTDVAFLEVLAGSLNDQVGGAGFEWVVLDNGSTSKATLDFLEKLKKLPYVRFERVEHNLGIIGGMRKVLELARNRYVLPLDSDDYLYPQCVSIFTHAIRQRNNPALLYSDEDKLEGETYRDAYYKPDWDPVLFIHSCYIAHLCAIDRRIAISLGVYTDSAMECCHDWDTFLRFYRAGHEPAHISEVLYSWRMHPQSTAGNIGSKPAVFESHTALMNKFIASSSAPGDYTVELSSLFNGGPDWRLRRKSQAMRPLLTLLMTDSQEKCRAEFHTADYPDHETHVVLAHQGVVSIGQKAREMAEADGLIHLLWDQVNVDGGDWPIEALSLMELFPDTVMVGGRIWSRSLNILAAGAHLGFHDGCNTPDRGRPRDDPGYFAQMWKPHSVNAVSSQHAVVEASFLTKTIDALEAAGITASMEHLGAWLGAAAMRQNRRIVYTPFFGGLALADWEQRVSPEERLVFLAQNIDLMPDESLLSPRLGLDPNAAYAPVETERRSAHLATLKLKAQKASEMSAPSTDERLNATRRRRKI